MAQGKTFRSANTAIAVKLTPILALLFLGRVSQQRGLEVMSSLKAKLKDPFKNYALLFVQKYTLLCFDIG